MLGTRRRRPDPSETFMAVGKDTVPETEETHSGEDHDEGGAETEIERADGNGEAFLLRPKRESAALNSPGAEVNAAKGAIDQFRNIPNSHPKGTGGGGMLCLRCGQPGHFWGGGDFQNHFDRSYKRRTKEKDLVKRAPVMEILMEKENTYMAGDEEGPAMGGYGRGANGT